ncbi:bifunctional glutamine synthetase adenylyltransferase/deadenyltransferase [Rhodovibrio sodomensis]|uniref:Bifunctional glutamine synthetase adenylyltransferase/adenylyl-removing enzyme n=1 Tax=Rhodovibrio sodomensis TaxID=1088 RepID=A0ABS1DI26_9PROT|nr:bifunctional [glutamine synthetase] adenylyltransferase/[glutamine synthetase]-adenylyl-L-tyrosine phosphorylase [Rhodovibrio sodomensis]MBK1669168.1 bifunctional glutamine synthetase adenylyltransferase/deadenyltransferase [Rhodovibrio sodomensis]
MTAGQPLAYRADQLPRAANRQRVELGFQHWQERLDRLEDAELAQFCRDLADDPDGKALLQALFANSPFLSDCALTDMAGLRELLERGPDAVLAEQIARLRAEADTDDLDTCMRVLRQCRRRTALGAALADITQLWNLDQVTEALSAFADTAVDIALANQIRKYAARGQWEIADPRNPTQGCGIAVLAMGKLGARELNYSSDIDLIVIHDPERAPYTGSKDFHDVAVRITRELVRLLEERTRDGFVFRCDLRLRPDPSATPLALSFDAAETYYESLGQNWERAAMIKARAHAGDLDLGRQFLQVLRPFVWRKHLDFWAIQDVHSIKRQIYAHKGGSTVTVAGHNVKLGRGGIREIEFYAQTQQLIWGGREQRLRNSRTQDALAALAKAGHIDADDARALSDAYAYLRRLEHRLQMVEDQQTQSLPEDAAGLDEIAGFMAYPDVESFRQALLGHLHTVEDRYAALFEEEPSLSGPGNLVFTGGEPDPETLKTLATLGYRDGEKVFHVVANWHRGRYRATRSRRAREFLTELIPALLEELGKTPQPDSALTKFDEFLAGLPAGVQLFSLLYANPRLLQLLASISGAAPALADHLSRHPNLLEAVLQPGFFESIPERAELSAELTSLLADARDFQDVLDVSRRWANDRRFQVGVHLLEHAADVDEVGRAMSEIAEVALEGVWPHVQADFAEKHGRLPGPGMAVIAMGKLGGREMTISSDLDLIFVYEAPDETAESDGPKPLEPTRYYARLAQRLINAISAPTGEGKLYEVDMRLRPSGASGPIAVTFNGFQRYQQEQAWTFEHMALTRARPILGDPAFCRRLQEVITGVLTGPRDTAKLLGEAADMRRRIAQEHKADTIWQVKHLRGGIVDLEFIAQALQLTHARDTAGVIDGNTQAAFDKLAAAGKLDRALADELIQATRLMRQIQGIQRLTAGQAVDEDTAPEGVRQRLAQAVGAADFDQLREKLVATAGRVRHIFAELVETPSGVSSEPS